MQVLGIRTSQTTIRYAILEVAEELVKFVNQDEENRLLFPAALIRPEEKINWLYLEFDRILRQYPELNRIVIKQQEFGKQLSRASCYSAYFDSVIFLIASQNQIKVDNKLYSAIGTRSSEVKKFAEEKVGKSKTYFDAQMADAIAAAWSARADDS